ncbi:MAG: hypothetical protein H8E91_02245 [Planctomycetes bacterium]|nr:hypothetical protein [Planctomycetota bacterium]
MSKKRKFLFLSISALVLITIGAFFAIPILAQKMIRQAVEVDGTTVETISVGWFGPQVFSGVHLVHNQSTADLEVEVENGLVSLLFQSTQIRAHVTGDANIVIPLAEENFKDVEDTKVTPGRNSVEQKKDLFSFPKVNLTLSLDTLTIEYEDSLFYNNVTASLDVDPGQHFAAELHAETILGGFVQASCKSPSLINADGEIDLEGGGTVTVSILDAQLPTINGISGWTVSKFSGAISSPNMTESFNVGMNGSLTEYDQERGTIFCKTQFVKAVTKDAFTFGDWAIIGSCNVSDVPTSLLVPFLDSVQINTLRDIGPTMSAKLSRSSNDNPTSATFSARDLRIAATLDASDGTLTDVDIEANIHSEYLEALTGGEVSGNPTLTIHLDTLVPTGVTNDSLIGDVSLDGELTHHPTNTKVDNIQATLHADVLDRTFSTNGNLMLNQTNSSFNVKLHSPNKNKLDGIDDLWKTIVGQLPRGQGEVTLTNIPSTVLDAYIADERIVSTRDIGETIHTTAKLDWGTIALSVQSSKIQGSCTALLEGDQITSIKEIEVTAVVDKQLATSFTNTNIGSTSTLHLVAPVVDFQGNATFDITLDIGKQHTVVRGKTNKTNGELSLHVTATGIDTRLLETFCNTDGILFDTLGSPISVEIIGNHILEQPVLRAGGTSPNAAFETTLTFFDGNASTVSNTYTDVDLQLSQNLTRHLLKDLGPVLSDIRSINKPIRFRVANANVPLDGNLKQLSADIIIDIGNVALDSGSITMQLLPMFKSSHVEVIPGYFEPIEMRIRNGIITYKEFKLKLDNKYNIPYSGTINLVTRKLHLKSAIPLTGLGYSIKELRDLATDIDVPILITGTIDNPITQVDPDFDLVQILLTNGVGKLLDNALGGDNEAPNPLDLIEGLFK